MDVSPCVAGEILRWNGKSLIKADLIPLLEGRYTCYVVDSRIDRPAQFETGTVQPQVLDLSQPLSELRQQVDQWIASLELPEGLTHSRLASRIIRDCVEVMRKQSTQPTQPRRRLSKTYQSW